MYVVRHCRAGDFTIAISLEFIIHTDILIQALSLEIRATNPVEYRVNINQSSGRYLKVGHDRRFFCHF